MSIKENMINLVNEKSDSDKFMIVGDKIMRFPNKTTYYINEEKSVVYDISGLHELNPVRMYIEENYKLISYDLLERLKDEFTADDQQHIYENNEYMTFFGNFEYLFDNYDTFIQDIEEKEELINDRVDLSINSNRNEYDAIVEQMKKEGVYDSYVI